MLNNEEIRAMASQLNLNKYLGKKVIGTTSHNYHQGEEAEIVGWCFDMFCLHPTSKYESYFYLCVRFSDGEIAPIPTNPEEMEFKIIE